MEQEMIKVFIVDDEESTRKLLRICINWEEIGCEIAGEAEGGLEALDYLEENKVDLVITDIKMPYISGLQLAERISREYSDIKVIVLTAYEDFDYAREGIRIGILDYIVKPIHREELRNCVKKSCAKIREEAEKREKDRKLGLYISENNKAKDVRSDHNVILQVCEYLKENYKDSDITLKFLADKFYVNKSFLCRLFKQEMGVNFVQYLMRLRIEKSMPLLKSGKYKVYEVAEMVGIPDANYFSKCLKKVTGMSVKDIKR